MINEGQKQGAKMKGTKQVGYSFPTSPNAIKFKVNGGYVVVINNPSPESIAMFDTENEAYEYADNIDMPYSRYDLRTWQERKVSI